MKKLRRKIEAKLGDYFMLQLFNRRFIVLPGAAIFCFWLMSGCAPLATVRQDGSVVKHYVGYVRVIEPPTVGKDEPFFVSEIETLGFRMSNGVGIGYFHERSEFIPLDCRLVIRVMDKQQLERVLEVLSQTKIMEEGLCVTVLQ